MQITHPNMTTVPRALAPLIAEIGISKRKVAETYPYLVPAP